MVFFCCCIAHCKNKVVMLAVYFVYYNCVTIFTMQILWMQRWKRIHAVRADTWINFTSLPQIFYKNYRKDSHAIVVTNNVHNFAFTVIYICMHRVVEQYSDVMHHVTKYCIVIGPHYTVQQTHSLYTPDSLFFSRIWLLRLQLSMLS